MIHQLLKITAATCLSLPAFAWATSDCSADLASDFASGTECRVELKTLHPTQFAAGYIQVEDKVAKLNELSPAKLEKYLAKRPLKVVVGPQNQIYIIDGHHLALSVLLFKQTRLSAVVAANFSRMTMTEFWSEMEKRNWVYLFDQNGKGPLKPQLLPKTLKGMKDDPYRSLADAVQDEGGYEKTDVLYAEFQWANFFRTRIKIRPGRKGFDAAVDKALRISGSDEAANLPGYIAPDFLPNSGPISGPISGPSSGPSLKEAATY